MLKEIFVKKYTILKIVNVETIIHSVTLLFYENFKLN